MKFVYTTGVDKNNFDHVTKILESDEYYAPRNLATINPDTREQLI